MLNIKMVEAGCVALMLAGLFMIGHHFGAKGVQTKWNAEKLATVQAEKSAIIKRTAENVAKEEVQHETNRLITKAHDDELTQVRADLAHTQRLRQPAVCRGIATPANSAGTGSSTPTDPASGLLPEEMDSAVRALIIETEEAAATGRAAQKFIRDNGMAN